MEFFSKKKSARGFFHSLTNINKSCLDLLQTNTFVIMQWLFDVLKCFHLPKDILFFHFSSFGVVMCIPINTFKSKVLSGMMASFQKFVPIRTMLPRGFWPEQKHLAWKFSLTQQTKKTMNTRNISGMWWSRRKRKKTGLRNIKYMQ